MIGMPQSTARSLGVSTSGTERGAFVRASLIEVDRLAARKRSATRWASLKVTIPPVTYFDSPVVVDNLTHEILSDVGTDRNVKPVRISE